MMDESHLTPKKRHKRRKILATAMKVFAEEGIRNADVQVIADLAGVGKGTIYRHFGNKEQFFLATAKFGFSELEQYVARRTAKRRGAVETLRAIAVAYAQFYQRRPEYVEIMIQERAEFRGSVFPTYLMGRAEHRERLEAIFREGIRNGELREVDVAAACDAFGDLLSGTVVNGCLEGAKRRLVDRAKAAMEVFLNGVRISGVQHEDENATGGHSRKA